MGNWDIQDNNRSDNWNVEEKDKSTYFTWLVWDTVFYLKDIKFYIVEWWTGKIRAKKDGDTNSERNVF